MDVYFKIGELSEIMDVSVRALHLYDKLGLLKPAYIDEETGYRYYSPDQASGLQTILTLKSIGFSLNEIKMLQNKGLDQQELLDMLCKKEDYFEQQIEIAKFNIENICRMKRAIENSSDNLKRPELTEDQKAIKLSRIVSLENLKAEHIFSEILWL